MRTLVQRVSRAEVRVDGAVVGRIGRGFLLFVGVEKGDLEADAQATAHKVGALRCFPGRTPMDQTLAQVGGAALVVSQFTLAADLTRGNRPGFDGAEAPPRAEALYLHFVACLRSAGTTVETGRFGATMDVESVNEGPATFLLATSGGRLRPA